MTAKIYLSDPRIWMDLQDSNTVVYVTDGDASIELHLSHNNFARLASIFSRSVIANAAANKTNQKNPYE